MTTPDPALHQVMDPDLHQVMNPDLLQDMDQGLLRAILQDRQATLVDLVQDTQVQVDQGDRQDQGTLDRDPRIPDKVLVAALLATILDKEVLDACLYQVVFQDNLGRTTPDKDLVQAVQGLVTTPELTRAVTTQLYLEHPTSIILY